MASTLPEPNLNFGLDYWQSQPATLDGVLGGFGTGTLPRVDALGSRQFLLSLLPQLSTVDSPLRPLDPSKFSLGPRRIRAVDVGAGIGRVTSTVLLHLVHDVVLVEPVPKFVSEAYDRARDTEKHRSGLWKGVREGSKSVTVVQSTLQDYDPSAPLLSSNSTSGTTTTKSKILGRVGWNQSGKEEEEAGFDVIWCQWCLGHLSDEDLISFFQRAARALRRPRSDAPGSFDGIIIVKENLCSEPEPGVARTVFDEQDSSLTRSDLAFKDIFTKAGLSLIKEEVQLGFQPELYPVKMYALR